MSAGEMLGSASGMLGNQTEGEEVTFNCLSSNLSSTNVSVPSHWQILPDLHYGTPIVATVYSVFFVLAFFWNLFIIVTYIVKRQLLKEPGNIFLFNLALVDFLLTITVLVYSTVTEIAQEFVFGSNDIVRCRFCDAAGFFLMLLIMCSLHILTALSIDRFILLARPLRYKRIMNRWKAVVIVVICWLWCFVLGILPVIGVGQNEFNIRFGSCLPRFTGINPRTGLNNFIYVAFVAIEALIPVVILGFTNIFTYRLVSRFLRRNLRRRSTFRRKGDHEQSDDEKKHHKQQQQLVRVFGALFIANIVSWTPTIIVVLLIFAIPAEKFPNEMYIFGHIAFLTSPVFHPILESFFVKDLRYQIRRARKGVRRASTYFVRQTTKTIFGSSALDEANRAMDAEEEELKKAKKNKHLNESVMTETSFMDSPYSVRAHKISPEPNDEPENGKPENGEPQVGGSERVSLEKAGRSVTFVAEDDGELGTNAIVPQANGRTSGSILKKGGQYNRQNRSPPPNVAIVEEEEEEENEVEAGQQEEKERREETLVNGTADGEVSFV